MSGEEEVPVTRGLHHVERLRTEGEINLAHNAILIEDRVEEVDWPLPVKSAILRMLRNLHEGEDDGSLPLDGLDVLERLVRDLAEAVDL